MTTNKQTRKEDAAGSKGGQTQLPKELESLLQDEVKKTIKEALTSRGLVDERPQPTSVAKSKTLIGNAMPRVAKVVGSVVRGLQEAFTVMPRSFLLKTERLSDRTKETHELLYKEYTEAFNKISVAVEAANTEEAKSSTSAWRSLKEDETANLNAIKLHELYFTNISDVASEISVDSIPYMRLARDFGSFERWQFSLMACALSSRNGWAMTVYEPYRNIYMNVMVDGHATGIPVGAVPVIVLDMWEHAYFKDYASDKKGYLTSMMRELNWNVIEARMTVAERSMLPAIYQIMPVVNGVPEAMLSATAEGARPPIDNVVPAPGSVTQQSPSGFGPLTAPASPSPATQAPGVLNRMR